MSWWAGRHAQHVGGHGRARWRAACPGWISGWRGRWVQVHASHTGKGKAIFGAWKVQPPPCWLAFMLHLLVLMNSRWPLYPLFAARASAAAAIQPVWPPSAARATTATHAVTEAGGGEPGSLTRVPSSGCSLVFVRCSSTASQWVGKVCVPAASYEGRGSATLTVARCLLSCFP